VEIYTIGFTKKTAAEFFETLKRAEIKRLVDVRLKTNSQLAGFAKGRDLEYFLGQICRIEYLHQPVLSPTKELLDGYRRGEIDWPQYEQAFLELLAEREAEKAVERRLFDVRSVLLCSEPTAEHCHRRLAAEYLARQWGDVKVVHL
jgi:uncharacterized protein (DUF488 family)